MKVTKSQQWLRNQSKLLKISYDSSSLIKHNVTKGDSREHQILDILKIILPQNFPVISNVVIIDSNDNETIKFDGTIIDALNWPRLYSQDKLVVAPIESIKLAFEVKSNLGKTEIKKIYKEAKNINTISKSNSLEAPKVIGFSYTCSNYKLTYYDFVESFLATPNHTPFIVCILNIGLFCFLNKDNNISFNVDEERTPVFISAKNDSLLVFTYILTEYLSDKKISATIRKYSKNVFENLDFFCFEKDFLEKMKIDKNLRKHFEGNLKKTIEEVYKSIP